MAIRIAHSNTVAQQPKPAQRVAQQVVQRHPNYVALEGEITREEFDALKHDIAELRLVIAKLAGTATTSKKSRAEYYREYRKRPKS